MQLIGCRCRDQSQLFLLEGQNEERGRCQESKAPQLLNDDIKIQTANVKKLESKRGDPNISNCVREKKIEKNFPAKKRWVLNKFHSYLPNEDFLICINFSVACSTFIKNHGTYIRW